MSRDNRLVPSHIFIHPPIPDETGHRPILNSLLSSESSGSRLTSTGTLDDTGNNSFGVMDTLAVWILNGSNLNGGKVTCVDLMAAA